MLVSGKPVPQSRSRELSFGCGAVADHTKETKLYPSIVRRCHTLSGPCQERPNRELVGPGCSPRHYPPPENSERMLGHYVTFESEQNTVLPVRPSSKHRILSGPTGCPGMSLQQSERRNSDSGVFDGTTVQPTYRKPFDLILPRAEREDWSALADDFRTLFLTDRVTDTQVMARNASRTIFAQGNSE